MEYTIYGFYLLDLDNNLRYYNFIRKKGALTETINNYLKNNLGIIEYIICDIEEDNTDSLKLMDKIDNSKFNVIKTDKEQGGKKGFTYKISLS